MCKANFCDQKKVRVGTPENFCDFFEPIAKISKDTFLDGFFTSFMALPSSQLIHLSVYSLISSSAMQQTAIASRRRYKHYSDAEIVLA